MNRRTAPLAAALLLLARSAYAGCGAGKHDDGMGMCIDNAPAQPSALVVTPKPSATPQSLATSLANGVTQTTTPGAPKTLSMTTFVQHNAIANSLANEHLDTRSTVQKVENAIGIGAKTPPAEGQKLLLPSQPCGDGSKDLCYPQDQLNQMADKIGANYDDLKGVADATLRNPMGKVRERDVQGLLSYLNTEERAIDFLKGGDQSETNRDAQWIEKTLHSMPQDKFEEFRQQYFHPLKADMQALMPDGGGYMSPFHESLGKAKDPTTQILMRTPVEPGGGNENNGGGGPAGGGGGDGAVMSGGDWQRQDPKNPAAYVYGAKNDLQNGDAQSAEAQAEKALSLDPRNASALSTLAAAKYDLKDMNGAASAAQKALEIDPSDAQAQTVAQLAHGLVAGGAKVPSSQASNRFADVPEGLSGANAPWHKLSVSDENLKQANAAARDAERALNMRDFNAAKAAADRALAREPHSAYAYGLKAYAEMQAGDNPAALRDAIAGLALNPADRMSQKARAQALLKLGMYTEALAAARAAASGDPSSAVSHYLLSAALAANGQNAESREELARAAALNVRFKQKYEESLQVAQNGDMAFLFPDLLSGGPAAGAASAAASAGRGARLAKIAGGAAAGGGLLAWLLWTLFGAALAPKLKTVFTRRSGPAVSEAPAPAARSATPGVEPPSRDPALLRGQYKTIRQIGIGGMGMVYEGSDVSLNRRVAIKKMREELRLDRRQRERFVTEAKLVAALHHPNVVDIYAIVDEKDELFLIFEYVAGRTLHEIVHGSGPLSFAQALKVYRGVVSALEFAHGRGVIHRDLKPSNIMVNDEGAPKVMDFGIARAAKDALTRYSMTNTVVGTPPYMAPEQEQGVVRKESDVFALAVCLYETLTGQLPYAGTGGGMMMNKINKAYTPASKVAAGLPDGLDEVFDKAFEPDPDKRYRSVGELLAALEALPVSAAA